MSYQKPRETNDILPGASERWQFTEETARLIFKDYQYQETRTPIFEHYEIIFHGVGGTTDIVSKEMYDSYDRGDRHVTLRPEGTAPVVWAFVENKLYGPEYTKPYKIHYMGPMFHCERLRAGRLHQFRQIGVEAFGSESPALNVEIMVMVLSFFKQLDIQQIKLVINSLGDKETHATYRQALIDHLESHMAKLSEGSQRRLHEDPLQVLDSKDKKDKVIVAEASSILDYLNKPSKAHFEAVTDMLDLLEIPYEIDSSMVRGLDYYTHIVFEIMSETPKIGAQSITCAGGWYNDLVEELGGLDAPGSGFGMSIERTLLTTEVEEAVVPALSELDAYAAGIGSDANITALRLVQGIRDFGFSVDRDYMNRKPEAQFKTADKLQAKLVLTIGENELNEGIVSIKSVAAREEKALPSSAIYDSSDEVYDEMTTKIIEE